MTGADASSGVGAPAPDPAQPAPSSGPLLAAQLPAAQLPAAQLAAEPRVERLELGAGSWVDVVRGFVGGADALHDELAGTASWVQGRVFRYERWIMEPRLSGQQAGASTHPVLADAQRWLERRYRVTFDGVALLRYRHERDSVAWHRDRELRWLDETVIGVLTLGARRPFLLRPLTGRRAEPDDPTGVLDLAPASGDLLVMGGRCQAAWLHTVPKLDHRVPSRISAQWRWTSRRGRPDTNGSYYAPRHFGPGEGAGGSGQPRRAGVPPGRRPGYR